MCPFIGIHPIYRHPPYISASPMLLCIGIQPFDRHNHILASTSVCSGFNENVNHLKNSETHSKTLITSQINLHPDQNIPDYCYGWKKNICKKCLQNTWKAVFALLILQNLHLTCIQKNTSISPACVSWSERVNQHVCCSETSSLIP